MLFNSLEFAVFLPLVFLVYWFVLGGNLKAQNLWIVITSYIFYGWWDWRFLTLIAFSSLVDYSVGLGMRQGEGHLHRKALLITSIVVNLALLGFFKYYNFFLDSFVESFRWFGYAIEADRLNIVLPVGISFYTFQTLSYSIDVYRRKMQPTTDLVSFLAYVTFFPQLVAGPIERATHLLPQFLAPRSFNYAQAADGLRQILWGLIKKILIADNCAYFANRAFNDYDQLPGSSLMLGVIFFAFQIYGDFSGYSDIAIGTSRLFGFSLMRNFNFPYFSRDIAEFWRRWHISLSTWFRDYIYVPLGGSSGGKASAALNTLIVFVVSGFWHGANWTFVLWGALNALYFLPLLLLGKNRTHLDTVAEGRILPGFRDTLNILVTFFLTLNAWVLFRSETIHDAFLYFSRLYSASLFTLPTMKPYWLLLILACFVFLEWIQRSKQHALQIDGQIKSMTVRWVVYYMLIAAVIALGGDQQEFIYFQF